MKKSIELASFLFLLAGTSGLLVNEYVFQWGSSPTLAFAGANVIGLVFLATVLFGKKPKKK